ncbi:MAG: NAD(P)H-quinone oxidoreductase [Myxococcota bacterium]
MHAILPGPEMVWGPTERPEAGPGQVRMRVHATAVNRADLVQQSGRYPPPKGASPILGLECAGVIESVGPGVDPSRIGKEVAALLPGGGYAEYVVCHDGHTLPLPAKMSMSTGAAIPETLCTAFLNLKMEGQLQPGERVLLHAGGSGVGTTAIELCRRWGNAVWITAGSAEKVARCIRLGADGGSVRHEGSWEHDVLQWSDGEGVHMLLDPVGAGYLAKNQACLATEGRMVLIGLMGGRRDELDLGRLLIKRQRIVGSTLRSRSDPFKAALIQRIQREAWPHYETEQIEPQICEVLPIEHAAQAHKLLATNETFGKIVLSVSHG